MLIEILYNQKLGKNIVTRKNLTIGRGFPELGQTCFLGIVEEEINRETGVVEYATWIWDSSEPFRPIIRKIKSWLTRLNALH